MEEPSRQLQTWYCSLGELVRVGLGTAGIWSGHCHLRGDRRWASGQVGGGSGSVHRIGNPAFVSVCTPEVPFPLGLRGDVQESVSVGPDLGGEELACSSSCGWHTLGVSLF